MAYVRLIHPREFDHETGRFSDLAFKKSRDGLGMSVFDVDCAKASSQTICAHIQRYYPHQSGDPPIFYIVEESELPPDSDILSTMSTTGDECHREIAGVSNNRL